MFCICRPHFIYFRCCFAPAGHILCTSNVVLHLQAIFNVLQMLFCTCRPHFMYFKCCFAPLGHILCTLYVVLHLQATFYVLQMLFSPAGHILCTSEFCTCRPHFMYFRCCFAPAIHSNSYTLLWFCKGILISYKS